MFGALVFRPLALVIVGKLGCKSEALISTDRKIQSHRRLELGSSYWLRKLFETM